jgi:hypothetical protein
MIAAIMAIKCEAKSGWWQSGFSAVQQSAAERVSQERLESKSSGSSSKTKKFVAIQCLQEQI